MQIVEMDMWSSVGVVIIVHTLANDNANRQAEI